MTSIKAALIQAIASMTEEQALSIVQSLGQWVDNEQTSEYCEPDELDTKAIEAAALFVEAGELALVS
jgi:hypothetical protein